VVVVAIEALAGVHMEGLQLHQRRSTWSLPVVPGSLASKLHIIHVNANAPVPAAKRTLFGLSFGLEMNMRGCGHIRRRLNGSILGDLLP
jgi:hypothetical protein